MLFAIFRNHRLHYVIRKALIAKVTAVWNIGIKCKGLSGERCIPRPEAEIETLTLPHVSCQHVERLSFLDTELAPTLLFMGRW
jgi:hypothetical protein